MKWFTKYFFLIALTILGSGSLFAQKSDTLARIISVRCSNNQVNSKWTELDITNPGTTKLTFDQNYLTINFVNSQDPSERTFLYRMVGLDYTWIRCDDCSQVQYAHLTGGDYTFQVKTSASNEAPAQFKFFIEGDIFHKWWFVPMLFFYLFVFIGMGIYFLVLYNFRQKLREQRLIHAGKMASMVELTNGIAHEIQNPLNFVNNYSEVSIELVDELVEERNKALEQRDEALMDELLYDLQENLTKIKKNGKRADEIVKGMQQHSRSSSGSKGPSDVNALVKEYAQQAYNNLLARDQSFHVEYQTEFDNSLPEIELVVLDIGQVMLNLIENAFYAVHEKRKLYPEEYTPLIKITTLHKNGTVEIQVKDNGTGIPEEIRESIFHPFFTTKPPGQGTGLGLSISDTIVRAHGGELIMESTVGEGTTFTLVLPL